VKRAPGDRGAASERWRGLCKASARLIAEGTADQAEGNLKQAGEKVKDAFKK
jgi:uncharacterized protein YjbJ (UPF0337 family)